ncbi:MAG: hypothetical protein ABIH49_01200 [archaeon]
MTETKQKAAEGVGLSRRDLILGGFSGLALSALSSPGISFGKKAKQNDLWWEVNWDQYAGSVLCYLNLEPSLVDYYFDVSRTEVGAGTPSKKKRDFNHLYPGDIVPLVMENIPTEKRESVRGAVEYLLLKGHENRHPDKEVFRVPFAFYRAVITPI